MQPSKASFSMTQNFQKESEIIDLRDGWEYWDAPVYQEGTRVKYSLLPPEGCSELIRPGWRYLFKQSRRRCPCQFWMEVVAYRVGCVIGVPVPVTHAAIGLDGEAGSLCEWMFDSNDPRQGISLGGEFMLHRDPEYDRTKGTRAGHCHNIQALLPLIRNRGWRETFARMFTLDTLIANTDRHHDNWGIVWDMRLKDGDKLHLAVTPAFDNGTSLGYERDDKDLPNSLDDAWFVRHATHKRGRHHIRLQASDSKGAKMLDLVPELVRQFPDLLPVVQSCATFEDDVIRDIVYPLCDFQMPVRMSKERVAFICRLICIRRDLLLERLDSYDND